MLGGLERDGAVTGVLAEGLLRAATSAKFRQGLMGNRLVLVSPFNPEAGFNVGNAMARNKYIYCLADAGVVVTTAKESGGTWNGAVENLRHSWVPLWIKEDSDPESGNAALARRGARWLSPGAVLADLVAPREPQSPQLAYASAGVRAEKTEPPTVIDRLTFYEIFVRRLESLTAKGPVSMDDLLRQMDIGKPQIDDWIKRAEAEGRVSKLIKPVRYVSRKIVQQRLEL
jgi:predicted Rossmann fold nucleotide-binding protein DprA/Smf involved in DNA uptake